MPRLTIAVDMTARASTPGTRNCTGSRRDVCTTSTFVKNTRMPTGMAIDTTRLSPRRMVSRSSTRDWARTARTVPRVMSGVAGELQEHLFEGPSAATQLTKPDVVVAEPDREVRNEGGRRVGPHEVCAGALLAQLVGAHTERGGERHSVKPGRRGEARLLGRGLERELGRRALRD